MCCGMCCEVWKGLALINQEISLVRWAIESCRWQGFWAWDPGPRCGLEASYSNEVLETEGEKKGRLSGEGEGRPGEHEPRDGRDGEKGRTREGG